MKNMNIQLLEKFLRGEATQQEVRFLLSLLDTPDEWEDWTKGVWEKSADTINSRVEQKMLEEIRKSTKKTNSRKTYFFWSAAASFAILVLSVISYLLLKQEPVQATYKNMVVSVAKGQKATITLPDGSKVWINSDSELSYGTRFNEKERYIKLTGEAYFEVAKRPDCPFVVQTGELGIKALGTAFNVKGYADEEEITTVLLNGKVEVYSSYKQTQLLPGQCLTYNRRQGSMKKTDVPDTRRFVLWKDDSFVFEDQSLFDITTVLSRQYNVVFKFTDESLKGYKYSGTIKNTSLQSMLQMFSLTSPLSYEMQDSVIVLKVNKQTFIKYEKVIRK